MQSRYDFLLYSISLNFDLRNLIIFFQVPQDWLVVSHSCVNGQDISVALPLDAIEEEVVATPPTSPKKEPNYAHIDIATAQSVLDTMWDNLGPIIFKQYRKIQETPNQHVFAFLPLRSYGFRFILQADWAVTSSREAIDASSPKNINLRDQVPSAFVELVKVFVTRVTYLRSSDFFDNSEPNSEPVSVEMTPKMINSFNLLFFMIPAPHQALEFFRSVPVLVYQKLAQKRFVPTVDGELRLPSTLHFLFFCFPCISIRGGCCCRGTTLLCTFRL